MKKIAAANKYTAIAALVLGAIGVLVGAIADAGAPCKDAAESFLASSPQVKSRVGKINSLNLKRRLTVSASTSHAAYISYDYIVRGDLDVALIVLKADPASCSFVIKSIDAI